MTQQKKDDGGFAGAAFKGAVFLSSLRWVIRLIGLVSVSITARILTPEDFGIHSTASIIVGLFLILQYGGIQEYLVKAEKIDASVVNTSWTVRVGLSAVVALGILAASPFAPALFNEPRVFEVLLVYACIPLVDAIANPRLMLLLRDMEYAELFKVRLVERVIGFAAMITMVLIMRTYWGIILGALGGSVLFTAYTYVRWTDRPRFDLTHIKEIGGFASVALVRAITGYIANVADSVAARQFLNSAQFGGFHNSKELASNLVAEIAIPIGTALLPAMSKLRNDLERFGRAARDSFGAVVMLAIGLSLGLYLVSAEAIGLVLGDQWGFAVPYLRIAALLIGFRSLTHVVTNFLIALDRQPLVAVIMTVQAIASLAICWALLDQQDVIVLMYGAMAVSGLILLALMITTSIFANLGFRLFMVFIRPSVAGAAMFFLAPICYTYLGLNDAYIGIAAVGKITIGGAIYTAVLGSLWLLSGRPNGPEQSLLDRTGINWRAYFAKRAQ